MNELILRLSDVEYIKFVPSDTLNFSDMFFCTEMKVYFIDNSGSLCIGSDSAGQIFEYFLNLLQKSIHGALILHKSLDQNLGFIYNEYFDNTPQSMMIFQVGSSEMHWVVYDYILWRAFENPQYRVQTWLYNNDAHEITLEVTKIYPWFYIQEGDIHRPDFIYYEDFIKDYKSLLYRIIPNEIAIDWLQQIEAWLKICCDNEKNCKIPVFFLKNENE